MQAQGLLLHLMRRALSQEEGAWGRNVCVRVCVFTCVICNMQCIVNTCTNVSPLCPGYSWPPLSTIVTLLLRWTSYCTCASLYRLVLLMQIHSKLRELLSQLSFVDGPLRANHVLLLLHYVFQKCHSERMKRWVVLTLLLDVRSQEKIRKVSCACAFNHDNMLEYGILIQTIWSLARCDVVKRFEKLIKVLLSSMFAVGAVTLKPFALAECVRTLRTFRSH